MPLDPLSESNCKSLHADLCKEDSLFDNDMIVTSNEIEDIIKDLAYNKSPRLDGISSEHNSPASSYKSYCLC